MFRHYLDNCHDRICSQRYIIELTIDDVSGDVLALLTNYIIRNQVIQKPASEQQRQQLLEAINTERRKQNMDELDLPKIMNEQPSSWQNPDPTNCAELLFEFGDDEHDEHNESEFSASYG